MRRVHSPLYPGLGPGQVLTLPRLEQCDVAAVHEPPLHVTELSSPLHVELVEGREQEQSAPIEGPVAERPMPGPFPGRGQLSAERQTRIRKVILRHVSETTWYAPAQLIAAEVQLYQVGEAA